MTASTIELDFRADGIAVVSLNRPDKLNIFNLDMRDELIAAVTAVRDVPTVRVMVLRANGPHFSAGADLSEFASADSVFDARRIRWDRDPWGPMWDLPVPTIAALHGFAVGSGMEMAMLCDIRFAAPDTRMGLPETKLGMLPAAGGTQSLTRVIGPDAALPIVATARTLDADEALQRGIVHRVVDDVEAEAIVVAAELTTIDKAVLRSARRALHAAGDLSLADGLVVERRLAQPTDLRA